jgi:hypothetical protein
MYSLVNTLESGDVRVETLRDLLEKTIDVVVEVSEPSRPKRRGVYYRVLAEGMSELYNKVRRYFGDYAVDKRLAHELEPTTIPNTSLHTRQASRSH